MATSSPQVSSIVNLEKGSRNKRKFQADPSPVDLNALIPPPQAGYAGYECFPMEKATDAPKLECHEDACDMYREPCGTGEEDMEMEEFIDTDWGYLTMNQLEQIILSNFDVIFKSAIKIIVSYGYSEEVAVNAIMRSGICCGGKDIFFNVVENALALLRSGKEEDSYKRANFSEDLQMFEKIVLMEMVNELREVRPSYSNGDAMWCLLICDMNVSHACAVESDPPSAMRNVDTPCSSTVSQFDSQSTSNFSTSQTALEFNAPIIIKLNIMSTYSQTTPQTRIPAVMGIPNLPSGRFCASSNGHNTIPKFSGGKDDTCSNYPGIPSDKMCGYWVSNNKDDEILLILLHRIRELQAQVMKWAEWGQQKVMQAARRLNNDKEELETLRKEKEVARIEKEKQNFEENTRKKLMEIALSGETDQVERANAAIRRLEVENSELRPEMEAAKIWAAEFAASCKEVSRREMETQQKFQLWERGRALFHEELATEKHKFSQLQRQFEQATEFEHQLQARWTLEETKKDEALMQAESVRKAREQIETLGKGKERAMRLETETALQRYKADIQRLEDQIARLRLRTESSKIAALRRGADGSSASHLSDGRKHAHLAKLMDSQELETEDVQRERECVMCLTEEVSVVFLPCAHQVVCAKCNELHEKQNMKDCPSCRTPIKRRICVRSADS